MIPRTITPWILRWAAQYPIVTVTGPRQSGKTSLVKNLFPKHDYLSLEDIDHRSFASEDPRGFLSQFKKGVVLDEIQNSPDLTSYIQTQVDENPVPGRFILTGSQQFELMQNVSQSLAGRTAIAKLLPFSLEELYPHSSQIPPLEEVLYQGLYPRIHDQKLSPTEALSFYISTYLERDIRKLIRVIDYSLFERFLKILSGRTGQILNLSSLGNEVGVSHNTIRHWISILETSFIIKLIQPWSTNQNKRLTKSPKIYFLDTGLVACLWGIQNSSQLITHPLRGALFETLMMSEAYKFFIHRGRNESLYFFRNNQGLEADLLLESENKMKLIEFKSSQTIHSDSLKNLSEVENQIKRPIQKILIHGAKDDSYLRQDVHLFSWMNISQALLL